MFLLSLVTHYCFCSSPDNFSLTQEGDSVFFTLPGQGSCSVIVKRIEGENVAVVLDAGASSRQMHVKFLSNATPSHFLCPKKVGSGVDASSVESERPGKRSRQEEGVALEENRCYQRASMLCDGAAFPPAQPLGMVFRVLTTINVNKIATPQRVTLKDQIISCQKETVSVDLGKKLSTLLVHLHISKMLVFLSHTDSDHINLIGHLPDLPSVFCVGGDVSENKDAYLKQLLKGKKHAYRFDTYNLPLVVDTACGDFLSVLLDKKDTADLRYFKNAHVLQKLNFLHLWLLNPHALDANSQSFIISATLAQQNMSMVFCGDATASTFDILEAELKKKGFVSDDIIRRHINTRAHHVLFSVPHHGSHHHFPEQIFQMFQPSAYLVNAGNGASYPHPHRDLISYLIQYTQRHNVDFFWRCYGLTAQSSLCTFARTTHGVGKDHKILPVLHRNRPNQPLVLGTNISGALYVDTRGVFSQDATSSVQIEGCDYSIEHNYHVFSGAQQEGKFFFDQQYKSQYDAADFSVSDEDKILYKNNLPYAKIYYSPVSKKWLGYLLNPMDSSPTSMLPDDELDAITHFGDVAKPLLFGVEDLLETAPLPRLVSVKA
ncbi:MAG TPA: hypothetical protein DIC42_01300 [Holosporales bacterium]|nr:hypothetical protein [Holosporales bacterium]